MFSRKGAYLSKANSYSRQQYWCLQMPSFRILPVSRTASHSHQSVILGNSYLQLPSFWIVLVSRPAQLQESVSDAIATAWLVKHPLWTPNTQPIGPNITIRPFQSKVTCPWYCKNDKKKKQKTKKKPNFTWSQFNCLKSKFFNSLLSFNISANLMSLDIIMLFAILGVIDGIFCLGIPSNFSFLVFLQSFSQITAATDSFVL